MKKLLIVLSLLLTAIAVQPSEATFNPRLYKSVQRNLSGTLGVGTTTANVTISSVNVNNTMLVFQGCQSSGASTSGDFAYLQLTSSTNVAITRIWSGGTSTCAFSVLEFLSVFLKSAVQRNTLTINAAGVGSSGSVGITTVVLTKSILNQVGCATGDNASGSPTNWLMNMTLAASSVSGVVDGAAGTNLTCSFEVVEFR